MLGPNITGQSKSFICYGALISSGALGSGKDSASPHAYAGNSGNDKNILYFNASNSNSIYTDNGSIIPLSLALNYVIKV